VQAPALAVLVQAPLVGLQYISYLHGRVKNVQLPVHVEESLLEHEWESL
jgi:hypothetical protein